MRTAMRRAKFLALSLVLVSCADPKAPDAKPHSTDTAAIGSDLVPNFRRVSAHVYSGGKPEGEGAFRALAAIGIRTVVSVDGETPDVESARKAGLRYVHLPCEYSGLSRQRELEIARLVRDSEEPILFHCHHGTQRGPAAAAVARLVRDGGTKDEALAEMRASGHDPRYKGLVACVASFELPTTAELAASRTPLPEVAPRSTLVEAMVEIDERLDRIAKGKPREGDFAHEALLLREGLVEADRREQDREASFHERAHSAIEAAEKIEKGCQGGAPAPELIAGMKQACSRCHETFRDR
jgi:protein tyrosine phosphatase (PTP) superfamily phosphohydrolase (DUF442 family)